MISYHLIFKLSLWYIYFVSILRKFNFRKFMGFTKKLFHLWISYLLVQNSSFFYSAVTYVCGSLHPLRFLFLYGEICTNALPLQVPSKHPWRFLRPFHRIHKIKTMFTTLSCYLLLLNWHRLTNMWNFQGLSGHVILQQIECRGRKQV